MSKIIYLSVLGAIMTHLCSAMMDGMIINNKGQYVLRSSRKVLPEPTKIVTAHIKRLLAQNATKEEVIKRCGNFPLHFAVREAESSLIGPLIQKGFNPDERDERVLSAFGCVLDALRYNQIQGICDIGDHVSRRYSVAQYVDCAKELVRWGARYVYNNRIILPIKISSQGIDIVTADGSCAKTWRRQITAFLMATHPRIGCNSSARMLPGNIVVEIARKVPLQLAVE